MVERKKRVRAYAGAASTDSRRKRLESCEVMPEAAVTGIAGDMSVIRQPVSALKPGLFLLRCNPQIQAVKDALYCIERRLPQSNTVRLSGATTACSPDEPAPGSAGIPLRVRPSEAEQVWAAIARLSADIGDMSCERRVSGPGAYLYDYLAPAASQSADKPHGVARQVIERRRRRAGRRRAEIEHMTVTARLQSLIEQLPGMPYIARLDKNGRMIYVSQKMEELLGFTSEQWCNDAGLRVRQLHPDDREKVLKAIATAVESNGQYSIDYRIFGRDGTQYWLHDEARVMLDDAGGPAFLQGVALDITERKQAQLELERSHAELQELIGALDAMRGEEQRRLAQEMHDDFGQLLSAMKMDLSTLRQCLPQDDSLAVKQLGSINELVDAMVTSVRRIIADLPPKILEDLGLYTALESMTRNFARRHRIACRLQVSEAEPALDTRFAIAVYRLVQEALNNVAKHALASHAEVRIDCDSATMAVSVSDDGNGMAMDSLDKRGSFGLIGMRERTTALGGTMHIDSAAGAGTTIQIRLPLSAAATRWQGP